MKKRLEEIKRQNAQWEKESPYNFCDRWCERCDSEKQKICRVYQDEFEQKVTCIAYGRDLFDPEITIKVLEKQYEGLDEGIEKWLEEIDGNFGGVDSEFNKIKNHIEFMKDNPLQIVAQQYMSRARKFLGQTLPAGESKDSSLASDFKTIAWYHTLLPVKLNRALAGFHEPSCEGEFGLYDAIAQFQVCKNAAQKSIGALRNVKNEFLCYDRQILELIALLHNIHSRIVAMEESI